MSLFSKNARAGSTTADPLPKAEGREKGVAGTPLDRAMSEKKFETATFGIG